MSSFISHLAAELDAFLAFKRTMGHPYVRAEFTLRSFDRFVLSYSRRRRPFRLDEAILAWLASQRKDRKPVTVTADLSAVRQFCLHRRRRDPAAFVPGRSWAPQSTESEFLPFVFTDAQVRDLLRRATSLDQPPFRGVALRALLLVLHRRSFRRGVAPADEGRRRQRWLAVHRGEQRSLAVGSVRAIVGARAHAVHGSAPRARRRWAR